MFKKLDKEDIADKKLGKYNKKEEKAEEKGLKKAVKAKVKISKKGKK